ncbi:MAG: hypothetical protein JSW11_00220 [Candidatus Heimdallarchaeota archaeon]|nr:MAG: hypothetical protein JSW11_00220 [Candidatus Heimdallarchaeota archaeon]
MSNNNRVFYAIQALGFAPHDQLCPLDPSGEHVGSGTHPSGFVVAHGVQSVGINTTFNLEQVFELGQLELYENIEGIPDIELTAQKVLDGYPLLYHLATPKATSATLVGRSNERCFGALNIYPDTFDNASGTPLQSVGMSGMYVSALTYTLNVDGNSTEDTTLVGNNKQWVASGLTHFAPSVFDGSDEPLSLTYSGGVARRENILMGSGCSMAADGTITGVSGSIWPIEIAGIDSSGWNLPSGDAYAAHLQTVTISTDLGREELFELGRRGPYHRFVSFPTEVTCAIDITTSEGDLINALADPSGGTNLANQKIFIWVEEGTRINLGAKNKLSSVTYGGGDAGGGNATTSFNYSNFNSLKVTHEQDPAGLST